MFDDPPGLSVVLRVFCSRKMVKKFLSLHSSDGRAEDCSIFMVILRSLVRFRLKRKKTYYRLLCLPNVPF